MFKAGILKKLSCEDGMFTLDALVAIAIFTLTASTLAFSLRAANMHTSSAIHREVALQLALQSVEISKQQNPQPTGLVNSKLLNGVTYEIVVTSKTPRMDLENGNRMMNLHTKVTWLEYDGKQKQVEVDALDPLDLAPVPS